MTLPGHRCPSSIHGLLAEFPSRTGHSQPVSISRALRRPHPGALTSAMALSSQYSAIAMRAYESWKVRTAPSGMGALWALVSLGEQEIRLFWILGLSAAKEDSSLVKQDLGDTCLFGTQMLACDSASEVDMGMVRHICDACTRKVEAGGLWTLGQTRI